MGVLAEFQGNNDEAEGNYAEALRISRDINYSKEAATALLCVGRLEASHGDRAESIGHLEEALKIAVPDVGVRSVARTRSAVVFPAPLRPRRA